MRYPDPDKTRTTVRFFCTGLLLGLAVCGAADLLRSWFALPDLNALGAGVLVVLAASFLLSLVTD